MKKLMGLLLLVISVSVSGQSREDIQELIREANAALGRDLKESRHLADSAYLLAGKDSVWSLMGLSRRVIGISYYFEGNHDQALEVLTEGHKNCLKVNDKSCVALILNEIGTIEKKTGDLKKSKSIFEEALGLAKEAGDSAQIANSLNNIGIVYDRMDLLDSARLVIEKSAAIKRQLNDLDGLSYNLDNLGMIAARQGRYEESEGFFLDAAEIRKNDNNKRGYAIIINNLGELYLMRGQPGRARAYFLTALKTALETDYKDFRQYIYNQIHETYLVEGNTEKALEYFKYHVNLRDSIFNETKSKQLAEIQTKYETKQKEQKIALQEAELLEQKTRLERNIILNAALVFCVVMILIIGILLSNRMKKKQELIVKENELRIREAQIDSALSSQEKERRRFARDLHDGFGQMISLLTLNLKNLDGRTSLKPQDREQIFRNSEQVLQDMHSELKNICFNLMPQTLIQGGVIPAIREFAVKINSAGNVFVEVNEFGLNRRLTDVQDISLYRVTQEWVNNILKYSDADRITIQLTADATEITLLIEDNGSGFDPELLRSGKGNGWRNIASRVNLLGGILELDTQIGMKGNTLIINVPSMGVQKKEDPEILNQDESNT